MTILRPNHNVWRVERANRAAVLIDAAPFFRAVREALLQARRSVFILGWDLHSRTILAGEDCKADDGLPLPFGDFLSALVAQRPDLSVNLLLWDYSVLYSMERELSPTLALQWSTPPQVKLCLDDELPIGSSHHQKIIVVDDALAFSGGLDLTIRRWDTSEHAIDNPHRTDPAGRSYPPFHDVQMMVDGAAARALAELARERWARAAYEDAPPIDGAGDVWPESVAPDFTDVDVGIARTQPVYGDLDEIREVQNLFVDAIDAAERSIYIENQYLTCCKMAPELTRRLNARPELEVLIVVPQTHEAWLESQTMRKGRIRFMRTLQESGAGNRVRLLYPEVSKGLRKVATMVHSKVMVIDDVLLRVGSANLNNRSMGTDTECDLAIEARSPREREAIVKVRNRLLGDHCGATADEVATALARTGSLVKTATSLSRRGHRLRPVQDGELDPYEIAPGIEGMADPERPIGLDTFGRTLFGQPAQLPIRRLVKIGAAMLLLVALAVAWQFTPISTLAEPQVVQATLAQLSQARWAPVIVVAIYVAAGLLVFPVMVLIAATAAAFGPWLGLTYAAAGALASALVTYGIGARLGRQALQDFLGPRLNRIRRNIARQGVLTIAAIRLVPVAPFTIVNLVAGASEIRLVDFMVGTILGMAPGLIIMSALGHHIVQTLTQPRLIDVAILVGGILFWIALSFGIQMTVSKFWKVQT